MVHLVSLLVLVLVFAIATVRPINMGLLAFMAAFLVGPFLSSLDIEETQALFPADMFIVVVGITLLFGIANANGTLDAVMRAALRLVRGRRWAILWMMFLLAAMLMSLGAVLAVSMLAPIAMPIAKRYRISPLLMGAMLGHGAFGAAFSPVTVYSVGIQELLQDFGIHIGPLLLFSVPFALNILMAVVAFLVLGRDVYGRRAKEIQLEVDAETGGAASPDLDTPEPAPGGGGTAVAVAQAAARGRRRTFNLEQGVTLFSIAALLVTALLTVDVGVASLIISGVLLLVFPKRVQESMKGVAWPAVLLVCGVVTYIGVLVENGTVDFLAQKAASIPSAALTALVLLTAIGLISAVGSSFGIILIALPLVAPLMTSGELPAVALVLSISFCATIVDVSPFSTNGVIVLSTAQVDDKLRFQRRMLTYCGYVCVVAPLLAWTLLILPAS